MIPHLSQRSTILIVDDQAIARNSLAAMMDAEGYQLLTAENGPTGIALAREALPDLVLLDVMMPGMDGLEVCRILRDDPTTAEMPVVLVTALDDRDVRVRGIEAGADDFISKPFDRNELRARVRTILRLNRYRKLLEERARIALIAELSPDGLLIITPDGRVRTANPALARLAGLPRPEALAGAPFAELLPPPQRAAWAAWLAALCAGSPQPALQAQLQAGDERFTPVELVGARIEWEGAPAAYVVVRDITERRRAELLEDDRRQLAYELHDGLVQVAVAAYQRLETFAHRHRPARPEARAALDEVVELNRQVIGESRRVIARLRPTVLDDLGLADALRLLAENASAEGFAVSFAHNLADQRLPTSIELTLYRVAQEALANARRHARAAGAAVSLEWRPGEVRLGVHDEGSGFDMAAVRSAGDGRHFGLRGMHERVALIGGRLTILSAPGAGTQIIAIVPLPAPCEETPHER